MIVENKKYKIYIFVIVMLITGIFIPLKSDLIMAQSLQELSGDKLTIEPLADNKNEYLILAQGNAFLKYKDIIISGLNAEFNTLKGTILFNDNVIFESKNYEIKGDKLSGNIDNEEFTVSGNSSFNSENIEATADEIIYNQSEEMAYLKGDVSGKQNGREFSAQKISIDLANEKIELTGNARLIFPDKGE